MPELSYDFRAAERAQPVEDAAGAVCHNLFRSDLMSFRHAVLSILPIRSAGLPVFAAVAVLGTPATSQAELRPVPAGGGRIKIEIGAAGFSKEGIDPKVLKLGSLSLVKEITDTETVAECPDGRRLAPTGMTLVCQDNRRELLEWYSSVQAGKIDRRSGSIIVLDNDGETERRYNLFECWPIAYRRPGPDDDCDGLGDSAAVAVDFQIGAIAIVPGKTARHKDDYLLTHNWKIEIDGCVAGGACPGRVTDVVAEAAFRLDASALIPDGTNPLLRPGKKLYVGNLPYTADDGLSAWILQAQGSPTPCPLARLIPVDPSDAKGGSDTQKSASGRALVLHNLQLEKVSFPAFDFTAEASGNKDFIVEEIEFAVERVERK